MTFAKQKYNWQCQYYAETYTMKGDKRKINGYFEGYGDIVKRCQLKLNYRLRKPYIWYGVEITIITPLGQRAIRTIEPDENGYGIVLVKSGK